MKIIYVDTEIKGYGMSAMKMINQGCSKELRTVSQWLNI